MGQEIQLKLNNNNVSPTVEKVGDGNLQGFTATDLTGAANELKNTLDQLIQESAFEIVDDNGEFKLYWYGAQGECPYTIVYENGVYNLYFNYATA